MNSINFEEDQQDLVDKTASIQSLADQIQLLEGLISRIEKSESNLKDLKKEHDRLSGEVIPTMMAEMGLAHLKLSDGSTVDVKTEL
jgi:prefoldin subunit 5